MSFIFILLAAVLALAAWATVHYGFTWWTSKDGKRVAYGLILAPVIAGAIALLGGCTSAEVFAGLEATKNLSPQCEAGGASDQVTSNLGLRGCRVLNDGTELCSVYRHHSCAISPDRESYDAIGFEVSKEVWVGGG